MFADPNCQATARRKFAVLHQSESSVEELIREFEIHGRISGHGAIGLVDCFEQAIHPWLQESIYHLEPMPTTWLEWKCKASLLDNQWRRFQDMQPKAATNRCRQGSESTCTTSPKPNTAQMPRNKTMNEAESYEAVP